MKEQAEEIIVKQLGSPGEAMDLIGRIFEVAQPEAVFGKAVEAGDNRVIVASEVTVSMGAGYGGGSGYDPAEGTVENEEASFGGGGGGGGGGFALGRPVAAITINSEGTTVEPIVDPTKIAIALFTTFAAMAITLMQTVRFIRNKRL
jgi:uncharacterized spore protein YtfJ